MRWTELDSTDEKKNTCHHDNTCSEERTDLHLNIITVIGFIRGTLHFDVHLGLAI